MAADYALQRAEYKSVLKIVGDPFTEEYYGIVVKRGNHELLDQIIRASRQSSKQASTSRLRRSG